MWRRFYFVLKTTQQSIRLWDYAIFVFIFAPCLCSRVEGCLAELMCLRAKTDAGRMLGDKTKRKSVGVHCVCASSKKQKASRSHLPRASLCRTARERCMWIEARNRWKRPGMHALYAAKTKKKMLAGTDSFPLTAWQLRLLCSGGFLWHSFFVWLALIHKYSAPLAFLRGECMRCGRIFALNWKLRLCWENSDESMRIRRLI